MGRSAIVTGIAFGAMSVSWAVASRSRGRLMIRTGYRSTAMFGGAMLVAGSVRAGPHDAGQRPRLGGRRRLSGRPRHGLLQHDLSRLGAGRGRRCANAEPRRRRTCSCASSASRPARRCSARMVNAGLTHYAPGATEVAEHLMEPALRKTLSPEQIDRLHRGRRGLGPQCLRRGHGARPCGVPDRHALARPPAGPAARFSERRRFARAKARTARRRTGPGSAPRPRRRGASDRPARLRRRH